MAERESRPALVELVLVRLREFIREPEAVFWTFIFPLLLATGLGIAFRNRPPETVRVGVLASAPGATRAAAALRDSKELIVEELSDDSSAARALRTGRVALVVVAGGTAAAEYRFDPSRPDARSARAIVNDRLQRAAGREDRLAISSRGVPSAMTRPWSTIATRSQSRSASSM